MARIRKHGANFSGEGGVESVDDSDAVVGEDMSEGLEEGDELVDGGGDSGGKVGPVDMEIDEKGGDGVTEGLEGTQFGGTDANAASEKGSVSESKDGSKGVESSVLSDKDRGKDEIVRECVEPVAVGTVEGNLSISFEAKEDGTVEGKDELMRDDKEEEVAQVDEEEREREQNVECSQSSHATSSNVEHEATGSVGEIPQDIPAVEVKIAGIDESGHDGDLNASTGSQMVMSGGLENQTLEVNVGVKTGEDVLMPEYVSPAEVSVKSENGHNLIDMAIDLEPYAGKDGNVSDDSNVSGPSQPEFQAFDLVWGKIRSHPWWPGQICDPSASSKLAKKYFKKHSYLIAYFWDCTFAWNEAPQIKPFRENFSQMEKQSNMEEFQNAVACALDEVSRRVEFGLACSCISKEVYAKLKTQTIINAGIKEEACRRDGGDSSLGASSFEPLKLINFAKQAAKLPFGRADRLELVTSRAQLSSFYRWKGYSQLPEFNFLGGLLENDADISLLREKEQFNELREVALPVIKDEELEQKSKGKSSSLHKRKHISGDSSQPGKKGKNSSNVTAEKGLSTPMSENGSERKADCKLVSQSSSKKRKAVDGAMPDDSAVKHSKSTSSAVEDTVPLQNKQTFRVGDRICRVATLLNGSSPIFRHNAAPADAEVQDEGKEKSSLQKPQTEKLIDMENPSPDEMLSQLCLAAMNPNKGYSMLISLMGCFSKFRNTICLEPPSPDEDQLPLGQIFGSKRSKKSTKTGKKSIKPRISEKSELELVKDSYSSDKIVKSQNENGELLLGAASDKDTCVVESQSSPDSEALKPVLDNKNGELVSATSDKDTYTVELQATLELNPNLDSEQNIVYGDIDSKAVNPALDDENGALVREPISVVESPADPKLNPNLDFEQENTVRDTGAEAVKPALDDESGELVAGALSNKDASAVDSQASLEFNPNMDSALKFPDGDYDSEAVKPASPSESCEEDSPAALILNFSDLESLPSEASLNNIFSIFGPLNESQTELLKKTNRAKVVFRRRSDAQKAFSSAGKYSTFGPSLESYRLKYPLSPSKASPSPKVAKQGKMDASAEGDGARKH
ncbi:putative non-specific serine/threonine protein kinase [Rosa chinensis]|uniref:Putative non-specific serine/threonine protein kinase n=1 Tax=Rosa chinensis TaxID=74649 RepID=A0A2P6RAL7_ROSCH|nr:putative non-specific serine/threonine protein kinase [Rosa chinensis]